MYIVRMESSFTISTTIILFTNGFELFDKIFYHTGNSACNPHEELEFFLSKNKGELGDIEESSSRFLVHNPHIRSRSARRIADYFLQKVDFLTTT